MYRNMYIVNKQTNIIGMMALESCHTAEIVIQQMDTRSCQDNPFFAVEKINHKWSLILHVFREAVPFL